jgi:hypothetical protein
LFATTEAERREREDAVEYALSRVRLALTDLREAQERLTKAEFQAGRVRYAIKKSGFSKALHPKSHLKNRMVAIFRGMPYSFLLFWISTY